VRNLPRPRYARSHLSWQLLPQQFESVKPKIVYTARNPKDLCVSYYHYCKLLHGINGDFEQFVELFLGGHTPMGSYWQHVLPFWKRSYDDNVLFIKYEDMINDLPAVVRRCAQFLNVSKLLNETSMKHICNHLQFDSMRSNEAINLQKILPQRDSKFIRKGKIGDWKNHMTDEMSARFDAWSEENLRGSGLTLRSVPEEPESENGFMNLLPLIMQAVSSFAGPEGQSTQERHKSHAWVLPPFLEHLHVLWDHFSNSELADALYEKSGVNKIMKVNILKAFEVHKLSRKMLKKNVGVGSVALIKNKY